MSAITGRLLPTLSPSFCVSSSISRRRPASTTVKPTLISASAAARPTPVPAPVTTAILFATSVIVSSPLLIAVRSAFWFHVLFVGRSRNVLMRRAQSCGPSRAQVVEIRFAGLDAMIEVGFANVVPYDQHVNRKADAEVGTHRGIH